MQVLEHQDERLHLALAQQQTLHRVQDVLTALESVEMLPCRILDRCLQQRQEGWQSRPESLIEREQLAGDLLTDASPIIALFDLEVDVEQVDDRELGCGLAARHRRGLEGEPVFGPMRMDKLSEQSSLPPLWLPCRRGHLPVTGAG